MKSGLLALLCLASLVTLIYITKAPQQKTQTDIKSFLKNHGREIDSLEEAFYRFKIFKTRTKLIKQHNNENNTWKKGLNQFSLLTKEERRKLLNNSTEESCPLQTKKRFFKKDSNFKITADKINWKDKGYISKVRDMKSCAASYAFAAVSAIESAYLMNNQPLLLSQQELIDCSDNKGCKGGSNKPTLDYIVSKGISLSSDYDYTEKQGDCRRVDEKAKYGIKKINSPNPDINSLLKYVGISPVIVSLHFNDDFFDYESGIYDAENSCGSCDKDNFSVLVVGFNLIDSVPYMDLKLSFGEKWGEEGFARMAIGERKEGPCFIAGGEDSFYTIV